jgi:hypothetical protein
MAKSPRNLRGRRRKTISRAALEQLPNWTPQQVSDWAEIPLRTTYTLLNNRTIPSLMTGEPQEQRLESARTGKRKRRCFRFLIPSKAFRAWWETYNKPGNFGNAG